MTLNVHLVNNYNSKVSYYFLLINSIPNTTKSVYFFILEGKDKNLCSINPEASAFTVRNVFTYATSRVMINAYY